MSNNTYEGYIRNNRLICKPMKLKEYTVEQLKTELYKRVVDGADPKALKIIELICLYYGVELWELKSKPQKHHMTHVRHMIVHILSLKTRLTFKEIGVMLNRATCTVHAGKLSIMGEIRVDRDTEKEFEDIIALILMVQF